MRNDYRNLEILLEGCMATKSNLETSMKALRQDLNTFVERLKLEETFGTEIHLEVNA
jgi:hypothetical protein